jgi:hypothetical protein
MTANDRIDWSAFYKICVGMANMRPNDFFNLSPREVYLAVDGFRSFHASEPEDEPMTSQRMNELMELYPD